MKTTFAVLLLLSGASSLFLAETAYAKSLSTPQISKMIKSFQGKSHAARYVQDFPSMTIDQLGTVCDELAGEFVDEAEGSARCDVDEDTFLECNNRGDCVIVGGKPDDY